jgi:chromosome segregation ATPase
MKRYTASELSNILGISETAVRKKLKRGDFNTVEETIQNRNVTVIMLDDPQLADLINKTKHNKQGFQPVSNPVNDVFINQEYNHNKGLGQTELLEFVDRYTERLDTYTEQLVSLTGQASAAKERLLMLEDKTLTQEQDAKFYKDKYFELEHTKQQLVTGYDETVRNLNKNNQQIQQELNLALVKNDEYKFKIESLNDIVGDKDNLIQELKKLLEDRQNSINILDTKIQELNTSISSKDNEISQFKETLNNNTSQIDLQSNKIKDYEQSITDKDTQLQELDNMLTGVNAKIIELQTQIDAVMTDSGDSIKAKDNEIAELNSKITELTTQLETEKNKTLWQRLSNA